MHSIHIHELIDRLEVSNDVKQNFLRINYLYYPNYGDNRLRSPLFWKLSPECKALSCSDKIKVLFGSWWQFILTAIWPMDGFKVAQWNGLGGFAIWLICMCILLCIIAIVITTAGAYIPNGIAGAICLLVYASMQIYLTLYFDRAYFYRKCLENKEVHSFIEQGLVVFEPSIDG